MWDWAQFLAVANVVFSIALVVFEVCLYRRFHAARFMRVLLILVGLYWGGIYLFVALTEPGEYINSVVFGQIFGRPAFTFTLAVMVATALYRLRSK